MSEFREIVKALLQSVESVIIDKSDVVRQGLAAILAGGHVLIEDVPGVAKTMMVRAFAAGMGCNYNRVQCTPDLLPSDVTGVSIWNQQTQQFEFRRGPLFTNVLLADEINRATPRTQSALLEAMAEGQTSVDGKTYTMDSPFLVFATQNPVEHEGTFPLPEAQLDRFMMRLSIGYPNIMAEARILERTRLTHPIDSIQPVAGPEIITRMQQSIRKVFIHEKVRDYLLRLVHRTRDSIHLTLGASPRASMMLFRAAQSMAAVQGRNFVMPDDIKRLAHPVLAHRLILNPESRLRRVTVEHVLRDIIKEVPVPTGSQEWRDAS